MVFHSVSSCFMVFHDLCIGFPWFFMQLYLKELDFKELGVLGYLLGVLGYLVQWRSHLLGVPMSGRSDEWKGRCKFPHAGGKVAPPAFYDEWASPFNGCSHGLAVAAPGHGQVALGEKKVALGPPLVQVRAHLQVIRFRHSTSWH